MKKYLSIFIALTLSLMFTLTPVIFVNAEGHGEDAHSASMAQGSQGEEESQSEHKEQKEHEEEVKKYDEEVKKQEVEKKAETIKKKTEKAKDDVDTEITEKEEPEKPAIPTWAYFAGGGVILIVLVSVIAKASSNKRKHKSKHAKH